MYIYIYILARSRQYPLPVFAGTAFVDTEKSWTRESFGNCFRFLFSDPLARHGCPCVYAVYAVYAVNAVYAVYAVCAVYAVYAVYTGIRYMRCMWNM